MDATSWRASLRAGDTSPVRFATTRIAPRADDEIRPVTGERLAERALVPGSMPPPAQRSRPRVEGVHVADLVPRERVVGVLDAATGALRRVYRSPRARSGFGSAVAIRGDRILIGAPDVEDGDGRAYLFSRASGARLRTYRVGSRGDGGGAGRSVALAAGVAVVGAQGSGHVLVFRAPVR